MMVAAWWLFGIEAGHHCKAAVEMLLGKIVCLSKR